MARIRTATETTVQDSKITIAAASAAASHNAKAKARWRLDATRARIDVIAELPASSAMIVSKSSSGRISCGESRVRMVAEAATTSIRAAATRYVHIAPPMARIGGRMAMKSEKRQKPNSSVAKS